MKRKRKRKRQRQRKRKRTRKRMGKRKRKRLSMAKKTLIVAHCTRLGKVDRVSIVSRFASELAES